MSQQSHRYHYIPIWYQNGFFAPLQTSFRILRLQPDVFMDAIGKVRGRSQKHLEQGVFT